MEKYIGLDLGTTTLGIVYSDSLGIIHNYENFTFEKEQNLCFPLTSSTYTVFSSLTPPKPALYSPGSIVTTIFFLQINRSEGERCKSVRRFVSDVLKLKNDIEFIFFDESYSTFEAKERLIKSGANESEIKNNIDMMSAFIILEDYLRSKDGKDIKW